MQLCVMKRCALCVDYNYFDQSGHLFISVVNKHRTQAYSGVTWGRGGGGGERPRGDVKLNSNSP